MLFGFTDKQVQSKDGTRDVTRIIGRRELSGYTNVGQNRFSDQIILLKTKKDIS